MAVLDVPQPTTSRHLGYLRRVGLVVARREGQWMYYRLTPAPNAFHDKLFECLVFGCDEVTFARDVRRLQSGRRSQCPEQVLL